MFLLVLINSDGESLSIAREGKPIHIHKVIIELHYVCLNASAYICAYIF